MDDVDMPELTTYNIHMEQGTETEIAVLRMEVWQQKTPPT